MQLRRRWMVCFLVCVLATGSVLESVLESALAAEVQRWRPYDESADIARAAEHASTSMHFRLINSPISDKNRIWAAFESDLADFSESGYQALKPLILNASMAELQSLVDAGQLDYETLTKFYLYRIRQIESDNGQALNAVIALNPNAIERARQLDQIHQRQQGLDHHSIFGMPVLLKDNIGFEELPTTAGAAVLVDNYAANAFITERLQENAAVILGKANLSEWAYFFCGQCPSGWSAVGGQTLNPYGRFQFGAGGSSSGSGAAVAANYAVAAVGSETSGSILSPASANSLVGLKPTTGALSRSGIIPISATLDTPGPMGRSIADVVTLFNAMIGFDQADTAMPLISEDLQLALRSMPLAGKRLGMQTQFIEDELYVSALSKLSESGALVVELEIASNSIGDMGQLLGSEMKRDMVLYLSQYAGEDISQRSIEDIQHYNQQNLDTRAPYGQELFDMMVGMNLSAGELEELRQSMQSAAREQLDTVFADHQLDVLVSINNYNASLAALANYPALTIPMGYDGNGRPMGLTLIAPPFQEQQLIDIGLAFERLGPSRQPPADYQ